MPVFPFQIEVEEKQLRCCKDTVKAARRCANKAGYKTIPIIWVHTKDVKGWCIEVGARRHYQKAVERGLAVFPRRRR